MRPTFLVNWLTFQLRNLDVAFFLESGAVSESDRGVSLFGKDTSRDSRKTDSPTNLSG